jgi:pimeloyl-ACP methyl ester carboxylesterase
MYRLFALMLALSTSVACWTARIPMPLETYDAPQSDTLLILLPGFAAYDHTFEKKGLIDAAREAGFYGDIVAANATFGYYRKRNLVQELERRILADARGKYEHIWVVGISMGGLGTLLTAQEHAEDLDGIVLLSPFLGRGKVVSAVAEGGGLPAWEPPEEASWEEDIWGWLDDAAERDWQDPQVFLGHGTRDLGVKNHEQLASYLGTERVRTAEGGHTWPVWEELLAEFVRKEIVPRTKTPAVVDVP